MPYTIYALFDEREPDAVRYVGFSKNPVSRFKAHVYAAVHGKQRSYRTNWLRSVLAAGARPMWRTLAVVETADEAAQLEIALIADHLDAGHRLVNGTSGGEGVEGYGGYLSPEALARRTESVRTPEYRALRSALNKLRWSVDETRVQQQQAMREFWASPQGELLRQKNSEFTKAQLLDPAYTGGPRTKGAREKMAAAKLGKPHARQRTAEWNAKISAAQKGKKRRPWTDEERARHASGMNREAMSAAAKARWQRKKDKQ